MGGLLLLLVGLGLVALRTAWVILSCYVLTPWRIRRELAAQGVTGPKARLLTGNMFDIAALVGKTTSADMPSVDHDIVGRLLPHYVLWSKLYGKRFVFWYGSEARLCVSESEMVKELLSAKCVQLSGKSWLQRQGAKHFIGQGLLMANGSGWFHQRHIVAPAFMGEKLKAHHDNMVECTRTTLRSLHAAVKSGGGEEVEIGAYMARLTGDIISRTAFDSSYGNGIKIFDLLTRLQQLTAQSSRHLWIPGSRFFPSKFRTEIKALKEEVDRQLMEMVQRRREGVEIGRSSTYGKGLLATLLAETQKKREGFSYTLRTVMDECKTFYFAGHDTTALHLTWTVMLLATNPDWQDRARREVAQVCGDDAPTPDHLPKLSVLQMIINESLRLYPPASLLPRMAFEELRLGELRVPKGTSVWIPVLAIHHDEQIWGPDANRFNPDRFGAGRSFAQTRHFLPFAAGPRNCVGQAFALMEAKIALAMLLAHFRFTISANYRHAPVNVLTLKPKHGVQVYLHSLKDPDFTS